MEPESHPGIAPDAVSSAFRSITVIIAELVCNVAGLLGFQNKSSTLDSVDTFRINLKEITLFIGFSRISRFQSFPSIMDTSVSPSFG